MFSSELLMAGSHLLEACIALDKASAALQDPYYNPEREAVGQLRDRVLAQSAEFTKHAPSGGHKPGYNR